MALKYEDYHVERWYEDDGSKRLDYHACKNYDEIVEVLNQKFVEERQRSGRFGIYSEYQRFIDENYTEEELYDIVSDIVQKNEVERHKSEVLGEVDTPYYRIFINFWWDASHYGKKKKVPKCIDWLYQATEAALNNRL